MTTATVTTTTMARAAQGDGQAYLANERPATAAATAAAIGQAPAHEAVQTEPAAAQVTQRPYIGRSLAVAAAAAVRAWDLVMTPSNALGHTPIPGLGVAV